MCDVTGCSDRGTWRTLGSYKEEEDEEDRDHSADGDAPCDLPVGHGKGGAVLRTRKGGDDMERMGRAF